jgi:regulator of sigma E protease
MILAYFIAQVVYMGGKSYAPQEEGAIIGYVDTNSLAYAEGLRIGDRILAVEGQSVSTWDEFVLGSAFYAEVTLDLQTPGDEIRVLKMPTREVMGARRIEGLAPLNYCYVLTVQPGSSAEEAGLQSGDRVLNVNGIKLYSREHMTEVVDEFAGQSVPAEIERDGETLEVQVRPRYNEDVKRALIGISFNTLDIRKPMDQIRSHASLIFRFLRALVTPKEAKEAAKGVGGPIAILSIIWISVQTDIILALWFTGLLNVNLAILNLLPIPILDGGHIVFALLEAIRRKPVSPKFVHAVSNMFAILLIMVFLVLSWRDVSRFSLFGFGSGNDTPAETNAAPAVVEPQD